MLRFAALSILYFGVGLVQWIGGALYARFVEDKIGQFSDLCSVCNVSVFILRDAYFGFYIHGRSVHGAAEIDMWRMRENFRKEQANMTAQRGLQPNSDQQTFEMHVPTLLRAQLDAVLLNVLRGDRGRDGGGPSDAALHGHTTVNRFLCAFLDHSFRDLDYTVQPKMALGGLLDLTPNVTDRGVLYGDDGTGFAAVLRWGHELSLFCFDFLVFAIVDFLASNYVTAGTVTYVVHVILSMATATLSQRNVAKKTMVDDRFLI